MGASTETFFESAFPGADRKRLDWVGVLLFFAPLRASLGNLRKESLMPNKPGKDPNYSWKGSPNAGKVLLLGAVGLALLLLLAGFAG